MRNATDLASDLECALFAWDADAATRRADTFVRGAYRHLQPVRPERAIALPAYPGGYARRGGETVILRANDAALALARHRRAA